MLFKKVKVVMLSTNEKAKFNDLVIHPIDGLLVQFKHQNCTEVAQNLYFLSDEEIKEGDWMFHNLDKKPIQWNGEETESNPSVYDYKKIIATTDKSLTINSIYGVDSFDTSIFSGSGKSEIVKLPQMFNLPQPSTSFIEKFVEEYNKGNVITEVMVEWEYNSYSTKTNGELTADLKLKINPKDNTITIRKVKESWNREEVLQLLRIAFFRNGGTKTDFDKFIKENL